MSSEIDMKKIEEGLGEICKSAINFAENIIINEGGGIKDYKEDMDEFECQITDYEDVEKQLKQRARELYEDKINKIIIIKDYLPQKTQRKYVRELNKMVKSKIDELKNYKPKSLEGVTQ